MKGGSSCNSDDVEVDGQDTVEWDCAQNKASRDVQPTATYWIAEIEWWSDATEPCEVISERSRLTNDAHDRVVVLKGAINKDTEGEWTHEIASELEGVSEVVGGGRCSIGVDNGVDADEGRAAEEGEDAVEATVDETTIGLEGAGEADDDVDGEGEGEVNTARNDDERSINGECLNVDLEDGSSVSDNDISGNVDVAAISRQDAADPCSWIIEGSGLSSDTLADWRCRGGYSAAVSRCELSLIGGSQFFSGGWDGSGTSCSGFLFCGRYGSSASASGCFLSGRYRFNTSCGRFFLGG